jgi:hypothetical protein
MAHGFRITTLGSQNAGPSTDVEHDGARSDNSRQLQRGRAPYSRSGTWRITWRGDTEPNDAYMRTFHTLFERQLNTFESPRVFLLDEVLAGDLADLQSRAAVVATSATSGPPVPDFDVVWDAGLLSRVKLSERLNLVRALDARLKIGGTCVLIAHDQRAADGALAFSISPEEIAAYFIPAYTVARHEEHEFALPPGSPVAFHTLVLVKQAPLTSEMLDPDLHRSLHAVAVRRRGIVR